MARHGFKIGDYSYGVPVVWAWGEGARLIVGRYCGIAADAEFILGGNHRTDCVTTFPMSDLYGSGREIDGPSSRGDIVVGSDVRIGTGAVIMSGVRIGDGAVIGAHALVTHDVEPYAIVAGNPARLIRKRFSDDLIRQLLEPPWWEMSKEQLRPLLPLLQGNRVEAFIEEFRKFSPPAEAPEKTRASAPADASAFVPRIRAATPS